jgi:hypothetical protein
MDATRPESVTTSYNSVTNVSRDALRVRHGAILALFGPNVVGKTTTARMIMYPTAGAGDVEATIFGTRSRKCRHNGTDCDRAGPQWPCRRASHSPDVRSREGVRFNLTERQEPQHARMPNCVLSSNPAARVCCILFTIVARLGNGVEAKPDPAQMRRKPQRVPC